MLIFFKRYVNAIAFFLDFKIMSVSCLICHEQINFSVEEVSVLNCGHLFHQSCIQQWLDTRLTCPECRTQVVRENFVKKVYPSVNEDADLVYRGLSDETKSISKVYEDTTKNLQKMFTDRIVNLENKNKKLFDYLQKCSDEKGLVESRNIKLTEDLQKSLDEKSLFEATNLELKEKLQKSLDAKGAVEQKNLLLILKIEHLKNQDKEIIDLKEQNKKLKKKLSSVMKLIKDENSTDSGNESTSLKGLSEKGISNGVPSTS